MINFGRTISALLLLLILAVQAFVQTAKPAKILLIETGKGFHGDEVTAKNGERWLGLYVTNRGSHLFTSTVKIQRVLDEIVDGEGQKTGKDVSIDHPRDPVFLVKGATMLKPGPATTTYLGGDEETHSFVKKPNFKLKLAGQEYQLKIVSSYLRTSPDALPNAPRLVLSNGSLSQTLYSLKGNAEDITWYLLWAGDVDGDGKLDLYVNLSWHYNVSARKLFLSSQASEGQLVRKIAEFVTTGC